MKFPFAPLYSHNGLYLTYVCKLDLNRTLTILSDQTSRCASFPYRNLFFMGKWWFLASRRIISDPITMERMICGVDQLRHLLLIEHHLIVWLDGL